MKFSFHNKQPKCNDVLCLPIFADKTLPRDLEIDEALLATIKGAVQNNKFSGKSGQILPIYGTVPQVVLMGFGKESDLTANAFNTLGAGLEKFLETTASSDPVIHFTEFALKNLSQAEAVAEFAFGFQLRSYHFDRYKTKRKAEDKSHLTHINIWVADATKAEAAFTELQPVKDGIFFNRDLLNLPPNVLYPETFASHIKELEKIGLKVTILKEKDLEKIGMRTLLSVGDGSKHESHVAVVEWRHGKKDERPLAFVGKGVTFDTGGISLKPRTSMDEMKYDMGGAAVVVSLMKTLALRGAKINAVGIVGLVENMPDGAAVKPADIIESYSGQTVEILDTDAEGRLVLCDLLSYVQDKYKPQCVIDLATLTGAVLVALGHEYAGLFSNNDALAKQIEKAGTKVDEKVWRLPLHKNFDKLLDSKIADIKNHVGGLTPGSSIAAQFLQRFIHKKMPWVHLDIAGTCILGTLPHPLSRQAISGYGVRLLNEFIKENYES